MTKLTEEKVMEKLNISSFKDLPKERFKDLIALFPQMDPELQVKALEQFPEFISAAKEALSGIKENASEVLKSEDKGLENTYKNYEKAIDYLGGLLEKDRLSSEESMEVARMIVELTQKQSEEQAKHRAFEEGVQVRYLAGVLGAMSFVLAALGVKVVIPKVL